MQQREHTASKPEGLQNGSMVWRSNNTFRQRKNRNAHAPVAGEEGGCGRLMAIKVDSRHVVEKSLPKNCGAATSPAQDHNGKP